MGAATTADPLRVDWVDAYYVPLVKHAGGRLGRTLLPGKRSVEVGGHHDRDLDVDAQRLRGEHKCDVLAVLARESELQLLGVAHLSDAIESQSIDVVRHPIEHGGTPINRDEFRQLLDRLIDVLLAGQSVVVTSRRGVGRAALLIACLVRDLGDYDGESALEFPGLYGGANGMTDLQRAFVMGWEWPSRPAVLNAVVRRLQQRASEQIDMLRTGPPVGALAEQLAQGLGEALRPEDLTRAYLSEPEATGARFVCRLIEPRDPEHVIRVVRVAAQHYLRAADIEIVVGPIDDSVEKVWRVFPKPPLRFGA